MTNILIIGAGGQIARVATAELLERTDAHLTLFLRRPAQVAGLPEDRVTVVAGSRETSQIAGSLTISPVNDAVTLSVEDAAGSEDQRVPVAISVSLDDPSEALGE